MVPKALLVQLKLIFDSQLLEYCRQDLMGR